MFGWGIGFYGPPVFLHAVVEHTGWPLALVSAAVTVHFLFGALVVANLPRLHAASASVPPRWWARCSTTIGVLGWASATERWQLFAAALLPAAEDG